VQTVPQPLGRFRWPVDRRDEDRARILGDALEEVNAPEPRAARTASVLSSPVGRLRIELTRRPGEAAADVGLLILGDERPVRLDGIVVRELRLGWITLDVPPLERWADPCRWLSPPQRRRIESAEFFETLKDEIGRRYRALPKGAG
jgi:hypothetical protein